mmetsp:Transcript_107019/g.207397  ORF Transcript_107019/g.207397 Transcript_107019/m.207397 type:complete len:151 (-) Transcript_107019:327-779(-)
MASDGQTFLEEGSAIQIPMTSEDERAVRPLARRRLFLAGMSCVALIASFCAIVVSTAQLGSGAAKAGKPELQGPQQHNAWAQGPFNVGLILARLSPLNTLWIFNPMIGNGARRAQCMQIVAERTSTLDRTSLRRYPASSKNGLKRRQLKR